MILIFHNQYIPLRKFFFFLMETVFIVGMVLAGAYFRFFGALSLYGAVGPLLWKALLVSGVVQISLYYFDLYDFKTFQSSLELFVRLFQSLGISSIILAVVYYLFPDLIIGRGIFFISLIFIAWAIISWRLFYIYLIRVAHMDQRVLIIGTGGLAQNIARAIVDRKDTGFHVVGFITPNPDQVGEKLVNPSVIGDFSQIRDIVDSRKVDRIIVSLEDRRGRFPDQQLLSCKMQGIPIQEGISFYENLTGCLQVECVNPSFLIFSDGFRKSRMTRTLKRIKSLTVSSVGLLLSLPLITIIILLIKWDSRGPVFYRQVRVGENGRSFELLKFRSMVENAETNGAVWAQKNDSRITRVGRCLRKTRLDEIPQMINVLKGDMSFVGPRPERPEFVEQLRKEIPYYDLRHSVRPGITGWAQIRYPYGATKEDALQKLKYDLYYIKNMSILFDLIIIFETVKVVLFGRGAR
jgi:sugar transferase (PEP-CTERM system associated)